MQIVSNEVRCEGWQLSGVLAGSVGCLLILSLLTCGNVWLRRAVAGIDRSGPAELTRHALAADLVCEVRTWDVKLKDNAKAMASLGRRVRQQAD